jgi:hypothetical protein
MPSSDDRATRIGLLVALELRRIVRHMELRKGLLVKLWSRHRAREPFIETLFTRWRTLGLEDLVLLDVDAHEPLERFYEHVDDLRYYLTYTEDMPVTLEDQLEIGIGHLRAAAADALDALGYALDDEE